MTTHAYTNTLSISEDSPTRSILWAGEAYKRTSTGFFTMDLIFNARTSSSTGTFVIAGSEFRTFFVIGREGAVGGVFHSGFLFRGFGTECGLALFVDVEMLSLGLVFGGGGFNRHGAGVTRGRGRTGLL
jgi:hypothetical protein